MTRMTRLKGKLKRATGSVTGDRQLQAEGKVEARTGHEAAADELARSEQATRVAAGDVDPRLDEARSSGRRPRRVTGTGPPTRTRRSTRAARRRAGQRR